MVAIFIYHWLLLYNQSNKALPSSLLITDVASSALYCAWIDKTTLMKHLRLKRVRPISKFFTVYFSSIPITSGLIGKNRLHEIKIIWLWFLSCLSCLLGPQKSDFGPKGSCPCTTERQGSVLLKDSIHSYV